MIYIFKLKNMNENLNFFSTIYLNPKQVIHIVIVDNVDKNIKKYFLYFKVNKSHLLTLIHRICGQS